MTNTESQKVMMTISVDPVTRSLMHKYGGLRGVGRLLSKLIQKHHVDETFGPTIVSNRLDCIEQNLEKLLNREENNINKQE